VGVAEVHLNAGVDGEVEVAGHLSALIPGDRAHELGGKVGDGRLHRLVDLDGFSAVGQMQQQHEA
jgi:hypothetical protein